MKLCTLIGAALVAVLLGSNAQAAFIVEVDATGLGNANFSYGGDTTTASASLASTAVGLTGSHSRFGGDGSAFPDNYTFSYTPGTDADNYSPAAGTVLGSTDGSPGQGNVSTGLAGGGSGLYNVYFTAPASGNVDTAGSRFTLTQNGASLVLDPVDQNNGGTGPDTQVNPPGAFVGGANNAWYLLGRVDLVAGTTYTVMQEANVNSFVSQRAHAIMWEAVPSASVPEPSTLALIGISLLGMVATLRRKK